MKLSEKLPIPTYSSNWERIEKPTAARNVYRHTRCLACLFLFMVLFAFCPIGRSSATEKTKLDPTKKGLALTGSQPGDVDLMQAGWWYVYSVWDEGFGYQNYVPMLNDGTADAILSDTWPGFILVFNEPSLQNINPDLGAQLYLQLLEEYPHASFVLGGVVEANTAWAKEFLTHLAVDQYPQRWAVHHYYGADETQAIQDIQNFFELVQTPLWVTEFGSVVANQDANRRFVNWLESQEWIERYAYFPTRMNKEFPWFPPNWSDDMALVEWTSGEVTPMGEIYRDHEINQVFIPLIISENLLEYSSSQGDVDKH